MCSLRIFLIAGALAISSATGHVEAGVWDTIKQYYQALQQGEFDDQSIPESPVEDAGQVGLEPIRRVDISIDDETPGIGEVQWIELTPEGTLLLTDFTARHVHEFSLEDGHYIRSFGRSGDGPGEYRIPADIAVDPQNRVYVHDYFGNILRFDRQGRFLDKARFINGGRVLTDRNGMLFLLRVNPMKIIELQCSDPATWAAIDRTPLSTRKQDFVSFRMVSFARICYSAASHRLYYLGPNDYKVKEIDAGTNEVIRQFGQRPEGFMTLPTRYHGIGRGTREDMRRLWSEISYLRSVTLVQGRFLLISHFIARPTNISWLVYDLNQEQGIRAYVFNQAGKKRLASFGYNATPIAAWRDRVYMWRAPSPRTAESSNGTIEVYALTFDAK